MDYFAHGFWSYILFHKTKRPGIAVAFGLFPDTISWFVYMIYQIVSSGGLGRPSLSQIPDWTFMLYNISHSLIIASAAILILYLIIKEYAIYLLAWPIEIIIDLFTHTREFLPTPFLWPISNWHFPGISWGGKWFMIANYTLIVICLAYILITKKRKHHPL